MDTTTLGNLNFILSKIEIDLNRIAVALEDANRIQVEKVKGWTSILSGLLEEGKQ